MSRSRLLNGPLPLHDVADVERLARRALDARIREWQARGVMTTEQEEDAIAYLIATAWELARAFDERLGIPYEHWCYNMLRLRLVDWLRSTFGDTRYGGERPELLSLDHSYGNDGAGVDGGDLDRSRPLAFVEALSDQTDFVAEVIHTASLGIRWDHLSPEGRDTLREIAIPLSRGSSVEALARKLGRSPRSVARALERLRLELVELRPDIEEVLAA